MNYKTLSLVLAFGAALGAYPFTLVKANPAKLVTQTAKQGDWEAYKKEQEEKIRKNDERIAQLKKQKAGADKTVNDAYNKRIDELQKKNSELRVKITDYKYNESKWSSLSASLTTTWMNLVNH